MKRGPNREAESSSSPEPELPGEFVSEDLRADCVRFLDELQARIAFRRELPPETTPSSPRRAK
jgi:hypothetical protein